MSKLREIWPVLSSVLAIVIVIVVVAPAMITASTTEIIELRGRSSKTYSLGQDRFAVDISLGAVHYQDGLGDWLEIDNQWAIAPPPYDWEMVDDGYHTSVLENFTAGQILLFESQGEYIAYQPMALEWTNIIDQINQIAMPQNVAASIINTPVELLPNMSGSIGTIKWENGYGIDKHFAWTNTPARLAKLLTLESEPAPPPQYIIDGGFPVLRLNFIFDPSGDLDIYVDDVLWDKAARVQTFNTIEFRKAGEVLWGFTPAVYWDSSEGEGLAATELRKVGNSLYVSVRVPYEWLQAAAYPVYIDPSLDLQVSANLDDIQERESTGLVTDAVTVSHSSSTAATGRYWGGHRWTSGSLPEQADTIDVAYVELYVNSATQDDANFNIHFEKSAAPAQFSTSDYDVTDRTRTAASTSWVEDSCGSGWQQTPSLVTPLQEVIDSYSPTAIAFISRPNQDAIKAFITKSRNVHAIYGAKLHIEWTEGGAAAGYSFGTVIG